MNDEVDLTPAAEHAKSFRYVYRTISLDDGYPDAQTYREFHYC